MNKLNMVMVLSMLLLAGCATQDEDLQAQSEQDAAAAQQAESMDQQSATPIVGSDAAATALQDEALSAQQLLEEVDSPLASRVIYFDYDSAKITDDSLALLESHGNFIAANGNVSVRLEGHADERGSREYNIGLGERRAQAVRQMLLIQGLAADQISTVSFG